MEQWKGADTESAMAFFAPSSSAFSPASETAPASPAMTVCCGELKFAGDTTSPVSAAACSHAWVATSGPTPMIAAIAP